MPDLSLPSRARRIIGDLESARQDLLDLQAEIWESIDFTNQEALEESVAFNKAYNENVQSIDTAAQSIVQLIEDFAGESLSNDEAVGLPDDRQNERIIEALDEREPHAITEDFTYKRPHGFVLLGTGHRNVRNWKALYERVCTQLFAHDAERFHALPEMDAFQTSRGGQYFARTAAPLRTPRQITEDVYAETHFSANGIRDRIIDLLKTFDTPESHMVVYLREDSDA